MSSLKAFSRFSGDKNESGAGVGAVPLAVAGWDAGCCCGCEAALGVDCAPVAGWLDELKFQRISHKEKFFFLVYLAVLLCVFVGAADA